jgi:hypothetical protein
VIVESVVGLLIMQRKAGLTLGEESRGQHHWSGEVQLVGTGGGGWWVEACGLAGGSAGREGGGS